MPILQIERGPSAGTSYLLENEITLGRDSTQSTINIADQKASRRHARIFKEKNKYFIEDLQSKNGTSLNGKPVDKKEPLEPGDYIRIGFTWISFGEDLEIERINKQITHYEILEKTSSMDGPGYCFKVRQSGLDRIVSLNLLPPTIIRTNPQIKQRFRQHARSLAKLNHENIAVMLDFEAQESYLYFTTEYLEGSSLAMLLAREKIIPLEKTLEIGIAIAKGLAHAHSRQVIHQDITPSNVMVCDRRVILKGFGMAAILYELKDSFSGLVGRLEYFSPEQVGKRNIDFRTDMFSFGVILYEMLAGRPPFSAENPEDLLKMIENDPPPAITSYNPDIPGEVEHLIYQCMEKEPDQRPQKFEEIANKLEDILMRQKVLSLRHSPQVYTSGILYFFIQLFDNPVFVLTFFPLLSLIFLFVLASLVRK